MKNVMDKLKKDFGSIEFGGEEYVLVQDAYLDGTGDDAAYFADAIREGDEPDEDGYVQIYEVEWKIVYPDAEDEGDRCDWEKPVDVDATGARFNIMDGSVF